MIRESGWGGRVITAYRPDPVVDPEFAGFAANVERLGELTGEDATSWGGYLAAHRVRRAFFKGFGATSTDHGHATARTEDLARGGGAGAFQQGAAGGLLGRGGGCVPGAHADRDGADEPRRRAGAADPSGEFPEPFGRRGGPLRAGQGLRHPDADRLRAGAAAASERGGGAGRI